MKKLLLLPLLFLVLGCSSDETGIDFPNLEDPLIGVWEIYRNERDRYIGEITYNSEGSSIRYEGDEREYIQEGDWENISNTQDFSNLNQSYKVNKYETETSSARQNEYIGIFSSDFKTFKYDYDGPVEIVRID